MKQDEEVEGTTEDQRHQWCLGEFREQWNANPEQLPAPLARIPSIERIQADIARRARERREGGNSGSSNNNPSAFSMVQELGSTVLNTAAKDPGRTRLQMNSNPNLPATGLQNKFRAFVSEELGNAKKHMAAFASRVVNASPKGQGTPHAVSQGWTVPMGAGGRLVVPPL